MARRSAAQTEAASLREQLQARPNPEPNEPRYDVVRTTRAAREP